MLSENNFRSQPSLSSKAFPTLHVKRDSLSSISNGDTLTARVPSLDSVGCLGLSLKGDIRTLTGARLMGGGT